MDNAKSFRAAIALAVLAVAAMGSGCLRLGVGGGSGSDVGLSLGLSHEIIEEDVTPFEFESRSSPDDRPPEFK
jgi:hypothetical protein